MASPEGKKLPATIRKVHQSPPSIPSHDYKYGFKRQDDGSYVSLKNPYADILKKGSLGPGSY